MIHFLSGILEHKNDQYAIVNIGGVGFRVRISIQSYRDLPKTGEPVILHTYLVMREDGLSLYGFLTEEERELFQILIGISGVGAKVAMDVLSGLPVHRIIEAVQKNEAAVLCQIPGIGKKRAERLLFDLKQVKHPFMQIPVGEPSHLAAPLPPQNDKMKESILALEALGFKPQSAYRAISAAVAKLGENADVSELIREGLKHR